MNDKGKGANIILSVLVILFCGVLIFSIIKIVFGGQMFTLGGFLDFVSHSPQLNVTFVEYFSIGGDWGIVDGLRKFLNIIMSVLNYGVWFGRQAINTIIYCFYFLRFLIV